MKIFGVMISSAYRGRVCRMRLVAWLGFFVGTDLMAQSPIAPAAGNGTTIQQALDRHPGQGAPVELTFANNIFDPGMKKFSNADLKVRSAGR